MSIYNHKKTRKKTNSSRKNNIRSLEQRGKKNTNDKKKNNKKNTVDQAVNYSHVLHLLKDLSCVLSFEI